MLEIGSLPDLPRSLALTCPTKHRHLIAFLNHAITEGGYLLKNLTPLKLLAAVLRYVGMEQELVSCQALSSYLRDKAPAGWEEGLPVVMTEGLRALKRSRPQLGCQLSSELSSLLDPPLALAFVEENCHRGLPAAFWAAACGRGCKASWLLEERTRVASRRWSRMGVPLLVTIMVPAARPLFRAWLWQPVSVHHSETLTLFRALSKLCMHDKFPAKSCSMEASWVEPNRKL